MADILPSDRCHRAATRQTHFSKSGSHDRRFCQKKLRAHVEVNTSADHQPRPGLLRVSFSISVAVDEVRRQGRSVQTPTVIIRTESFKQVAQAWQKKKQQYYEQSVDITLQHDIMD